MKKDELKQAFGGLEPTEELTKEVWTRVEKNMETVKKRKVSKIVKAAAVVLIAAGLLGGINGLSGNKLVEALVSFWHVDKESQSILKDMTDYHVMVDTVYAPKLLELYGHFSICKVKVGYNGVTNGAIGVLYWYIVLYSLI